MADNEIRIAVSLLLPNDHEI